MCKQMCHHIASPAYNDINVCTCSAAWSTLVIAPHSLTESMPIAFTQAIRDLRFRTVDYFLVALYCIVYLLNLLGTSMDEELEYAVSRNPQFYKEPITDAFKARVERWHALNAIKCVFLLVAWLLVRVSLHTVLPGLHKFLQYTAMHKVGRLCVSRDEGMLHCIVQGWSLLVIEQLVIDRKMPVDSCQVRSSQTAGSKVASQLFGQYMCSTGRVGRR